MKELEREMRQKGIGGYFDALKPLAKNAVHMELDVAEDDEIPVGASKMGGCPDLPAGMEWPRMASGIPLSFIAQIDFGEVKPHDLENKLPDRGVLSFFYDCSDEGMPWGFDPKDADGWRVLFHDGNAPLERLGTPEDLEVTFDAARLSFEAAAELPCYDSDLCNDLDLPEEEEDDYWDWLEEKEDLPGNKLLGHSDNIQSGMELECEYVTSGIYCGNPDGYEEAKRRGLDKNAVRWNLLMQVESNEDIGMMWGDLGRLYLWITAEDLEARRFENTWLILQCG